MIITTSDGKIARTSPVPFGDVIEDLNGKYGVANVLRDCGARGLRPLTSPQLLDLRSDCPNIKDGLWSNWYTTASGVYVIGSNVYVVHGLKHPLTSHQRVRDAVDEGLVNSAAKLTDEEAQLFSGRGIDGLRDYDTFLRETKDKDLADEQFGVVADLNFFKGLPNDYMALNKWVKDPRAVMLAGGKRRAEAYAEVLNRNKVKQPWLSLEVEADKADRGRLVFVSGGDSGYGVDGSSDLGNCGRVVGVAPEAQLVVKNKALDAPLEQRVELLQGGKILVHEGRTYVLDPEGLELR